jgi:probable HAF family extracellular repeat protein
MPYQIIGKIAAVCAAVGLAITPLCVHAQTNMVDLGNTASTGAPVAINNAGQIAFSTGLYSNGTLTPLGTLPGASVNAIAAGINSAGVIVGNVDFHGTIAPGECSGQVPVLIVPVLFTNGTLTGLPLACSSDSPSSTATGINASGEVVGYATGGQNDATSAFVISNGSYIGFTPDPNLFGEPSGVGVNSEAFAVSNNGIVTGMAQNVLPANPENDAFIANNGVWTNLGAGSGLAVNNNGQVTGYLVVGGQYHAFFYSAGVTTDLSNLTDGVGGEGLAINATGQVVGSLSQQGGFFYNGVVTNLNALIGASDPLKPFVTLSEGVGITDNRLILAEGTDSRDGSAHSYLVQAPWLDIAPGLLSFASTRIGSVSVAQSVSLTNSGSAAIPIDSITISGDFALQQNACGTSLAVGATCTATVAFAPTASGDRRGVLTVTSNSVPLAVTLIGVSPISLTLSAKPTSLTTGSLATLTWTLSPGTACTATGGVGGDGWTGAITSSGSRTVTEAAGTTYTYGLDCTAGTQTAQISTTITFISPPVTVSVSASPTTFTAGQSTTITWSSKNATSCTASGGGTGDKWPGALATSGSQAVTEVYVPAAPLVLTFTVTCTSNISGLSGMASAQVTEDPPQSKGGGALDPLSVMGLLILLGLKLLSRRREGGLHATS